MSLAYKRRISNTLEYGGTNDASSPAKVLWDNGAYLRRPANALHSSLRGGNHGYAPAHRRPGGDFGARSHHRPGGHFGARGIARDLHSGADFNAQAHRRRPAGEALGYHQPVDRQR